MKPLLLARMEPSLANVLTQDTLRWIFVGGKGGVGKTTTSCSLAVQLAAVRASVLVVSTDPAHNLSDAFDQRFSGTPSLVTGFTNLYCMEIDSSAGASMFGEADASGESGGMLSMFSEFTSAIPGWDEVMGFLTILKTVKSTTYDCVVFDTAPTGHTLRLLSFPQVRAMVAQRHFRVFPRISDVLPPIAGNGQDTRHGHGNAEQTWRASEPNGRFRRLGQAV